MSKRMKRAMTAITLTIGLTLILSFSILPIDTTKQFDISEYSYEADFSVELEHMPVVAQQTGYTCYAVSMVIVRTYLGLETTENSLLTDFGLQDRGSGMIPREYLPLAQEALGALSYSITLSNAKSETEILNLITGSLTEGLPVIIYYSTLDDWNKPRYNTHYGVIYGVDMEKQVVKLSNPYGYLVELPFEDLFNGLAFDNYENEPLIHRLGRVTGCFRRRQKRGSRRACLSASSRI